MNEFILGLILGFIGGSILMNLICFACKSTVHEAVREALDKLDVKELK